MLGCGERLTKANKGKSGKGPVKVFLPPTPDLARPEPAKSHQDQVYTVYGLLKDAQEKVGKEITVRGILSEVRVCREEDERLCALPTHAMLTDEVGDITRTIPIVGTRLKYMSGIEPGAQVDLQGRLDTLSSDGRIVSLEGLLLLAPPTEDELNAAKKGTKRKRRKAPSINVVVP